MAPNNSNRSYWFWLCLLLVVVLAAVVRIRLLEVPLERDEGEYAYAGQLMLQGVPPYAQAYNMKMPGIYAAYAVVLATFGETHGAIHLGLLLVNGATILLVGLLARRKFGDVAGAAAAAAFALLSLGQPVQGVFANAEHFVILPAVGGLIVLLRAIESRSFATLLAGAVLLGLAPVMKQHGAAFIAFGGLFLLWTEARRDPFRWGSLAARAALFLLGVSLPFAATCLMLWASGVFDKFWFWTVDYAREYVAGAPLSAGLELLQRRLARLFLSAPLLWILAAVGMVWLWWKAEARRHAPFAAGLLLFSFLAVCPGLYFRSHYFVLALPAVALMAGIGASAIAALPLRRVLSVTLLLIIIGQAVYQQRDFLFVWSPYTVARKIYGRNPFPESLPLAEYIKENSSKEARIAVIGSEPQIYFYSGRRSASGYIYTYALMESHPYSSQMQREMIEEIEAASPEFLVFVSVPTSWLMRSDSDRTILSWFDSYRRLRYRPVAIAEIRWPQETIYLWGEEAAAFDPRSRHWVAVFARGRSEAR
jgi:4-amino-4-deoxy-L-arabinose transferase-like glycosyltransferase